MEFDVVIGNPPYNNDLYIDFVTLGHKISSQYTCMITPAKWQAKGGIKNEKFREDIVPYMSDIVFYPDAFELFDIREQEGITIFVMDKETHKQKQVDITCGKNNSFNSSGVRSDIDYTLYGGLVNSIIRKFNGPKMLNSVINDKSGTFVDLTCRGGVSR